MAYEHRMYLPCIFLIGAFVNFVTNRFYGRNKVTLITAFLATAVLLGTLTGVRGRVWENEFTLWSDVVNKYPEDERAWYNIGFEYYRNVDYDKAMRWYNKALEVDPQYEDALFAIGDIYEIVRNYDPAEKYYKEALLYAKEGDDIHLQALNNLGAVYIKTGRYKEAESIYKGLDTLSPKSGLVHSNLGLALKGQKKNKAAAREFTLAIEYSNSSLKVFRDALRHLIMLGETEEVMRLYGKYKETIDKLCIGNFIKYTIAKSKKDEVNAKKYYDLYIACTKATIN
jgi:tetratricopeptide (TPR) repeat protein